VGSRNGCVFNYIPEVILHRRFRALLYRVTEAFSPDVSHVDLLTDVFDAVFHECAYVCAQGGKTALDFAKEYGQHNVVQLIEVRFRSNTRIGCV
jgi:hypothetical protein